MSSTDLARNGTPRNLSAKQMTAIAALLVSGNREQAAKDSGISKGTLYRWLGDAEFIAALRTAEAEALRDVTREMVGLSRLAVSTLRRVMTDEQASMNSQIRAAIAVLTQLPAYRELTDLETRLTDLEARMEAINDEH
ncbi:hypothetical protein BH23CHL4_BH23CHL4_29430 [soil metagenome]